MKISKSLTFVIKALIVCCCYCPLWKSSSGTTNTCPLHCVCLSSVSANCKAANITNDSYFWAELHPEVEDFNIARNNLRTIPAELFRFPEITDLSLSENNIARIAADAFGGLKKLEVLDLSENNVKHLSDIHAGVLLLKNIRLRLLKLSGNPIVHLGNNFKDVLYSTSLRWLDVSRCEISYVRGPVSLQGLPNLRFLNLSSNPLTTLDGITSASLIALDAANCALQFLRPDTFSQLSALKRLNVSDNARLSGQFKLASPTLEVFEADRCLLDSVSIPDLPNVRKISLKNNRLKEIVASCFQRNELLRELDLSENAVWRVSEFGFTGCASLTYLDLSRNFLTDVPENTFAFNPNLTTLNLSRNLLNRLPRLRAPSLVTLDVSRCEIRAVEDKCLIYMSSLRTLNLSYNPLETLPSASLSSPTMNELNLSFCRLLTLNSSAIYELPHLNRLDLTGNRLVYLRNNTFSGNVHLECILLANNPWLCDCRDDNFKTLRVFLSNRTTNEAELDAELTCLSPLNMTGLRWSVACDQFWSRRRQPKNGIDLILLCAVLGILSLCGMLAFAVGYKKKLFWTTNESRRTTRNDSDRNSEDEDGSIGDNGENDDRISQTTRKLCKLPTYDEALLLPQISVEDVFSNTSKSTKRQSGTQTEETMETPMTEMVKQISAQSSRHSMREVEYINLPAPIQCTEL